MSTGPRPPVRPRGPPPTAPPQARPPPRKYMFCDINSPHILPATQAVMGLGDLKKPGGPPPRPPANAGAPMMKLKPPPMAPPPREMLANASQRPAIQNIKAIDPSKTTLAFGEMDDKTQPGPGPGRGPPPGRGFTPGFAPTEFEPDSKTGIIEQGRKGAAPPKFQLKPTKKEGAISMFEADPNEKLPPSDAKVKPSRPPPPSGPPSGIPEGKPLPPTTLPPSTKAAPRPMRPPPGKGRAPPPVEPDEAESNLKKHPPQDEPPFKRGYKKPKVEEVVIVKRRDKDDPEFEESSSDEEGGDKKDAIPQEGAAPMEVTEQVVVKDTPAVGAPTTANAQGSATAAPQAVVGNKTPAVDAIATPAAKDAAGKIDSGPAKQVVQQEATPEKNPSRPASGVPVSADKAPAKDVDPSKQVKKEEATPEKHPSRPPSGAPTSADKTPSRPASGVEKLSSRPSSEAEGARRSSAMSKLSENISEQSAQDDMMSEVSGSVASQLITAPPPGIVVHRDPNASLAQREGVGDFIPPVALNIEGMESNLSKEIKGGRLNVTCLSGIGLKKREDKSKNPRVDPYIKFKLGAADKWPWKQTAVRRKQESNADFGEELVSFDVVKPSQFIYQEDIQLCIEVWNKGTFKDEIIGTVTMSVVRFFKNPFKAYTEKIPIVAPGDRTSTSKVANHNHQ